MSQFRRVTIKSWFAFTPAVCLWQVEHALAKGKCPIFPHEGLRC